MNIDREAFERTRRNAIERLLAERDERGVWVGELSSSALSTATAITALHLDDPVRHEGRIAAGVEWLLVKQNADGGWGDTDKSFSNISTTTLCWAALGMIGGGDEAVARAEAWLREAAGSIDHATLVEAIMARYGKDRTFSVPILTMATLCERFGPRTDAASWRWVKQLPFELAALPQGWYRRVNLQVVSYALPALIAIGQVRHHHRPTWNPVARIARTMSKRKTFDVLRRIQPSTGGYLEATPLTSFVCMSLAGMRDALTPEARDVLAHGVEFLENSQRGDGSWAIDTNLATWATTLSVNALAAGGRLNEYLDEADRARIRDWLLDQQYTEVHPFTGAAPGGWAWTDLPGGVPDADDTSGAVLALWHLSEKVGFQDSESIGAMVRGADWLVSTINRDGGIPTFCRGWGRLPFDRSSTDITAHARNATYAGHLATLDEAWRQDPVVSDRLAPGSVRRQIDRFLSNAQGEDGEWIPLWFGNQFVRGEENAIYGTARVVASIWMYFREDPIRAKTSHAIDWLLSRQSSEGGWGGGTAEHASVEESALVLEALACVVMQGGSAAARQPLNAAIERGVAWLIEHTDEGTFFDAAPIGFYFAKLWYYEKLYPIIWTVGALERVRALLDAEDSGGVGDPNETSPGGAGG